MFQENKSKIRIFYDDACGLCHKFVVFVLQNMKDETFVFSPQSGTSFRRIKNSEKYPRQSIVAYIENEDKVFLKGAAIKLVLFHLEWPWICISYLLSCIPSPVLNFLYDLVARSRHKFFKKPQDICPVVPPKWSKLFED